MMLANHYHLCLNKYHCATIDFHYYCLQSDLILGYYCDRRRPDNFMLSHVVKAAMHLLRARITSPLQPSQLTVPLPTDLYLRREAPIIFDDSELGAVLSPLKSTRAK